MFSAYSKIPMLLSPSFIPSLSRFASLITSSKAMLNKTGEISEII
jgi:hypothetical protein